MRLDRVSTIEWLVGLAASRASGDAGVGACTSAPLLGVEETEAASLIINYSRVKTMFLWRTKP